MNDTLTFNHNGVNYIVTEQGHLVHPFGGTNHRWHFAEYVSEFDDGAVVCRSTCKYSPDLNVAFDIELASNHEDADFADCLTREYVQLADATTRDATDGTTFDY